MWYNEQGKNKLSGCSCRCKLQLQVQVSAADTEAIRAVAVLLCHKNRLHLIVIQKGLDFAAERTHFILV